MEKAKNTIYKHPKWFIGGQKTVYEAMKYFAESPDFYLDTTLKYVPKEIDRTKPYNVLGWLIENKKYKDLVIRYAGSEGGTDRGILKIKTYLELL